MCFEALPYTFPCCLANAQSFIHTESFPPPASVHLVQVNSSRMVFYWNMSTNSYCPSLHYNILSMNCGICPDTTENTEVTCFNFIPSDSTTVCSFMVQVVICNNSDTPLSGDFSSPAVVNLTGMSYYTHYSSIDPTMCIYFIVPKVVQVISIPHYHVDNGLRRLTVNFSTVVCSKLTMSCSCIHMISMLITEAYTDYSLIISYGG